MSPPTDQSHVVVVCGGAVAGSEAAAIFASHGMRVVVLEQNTRPYGKVEDGLPRWHDKLREKEYDLIDRNLDAPAIAFVPRLRIGADLSLDELRERWAPSAIVLATGAWRDRPLPIPGADAYVGRGLVYQNPLVHWFNHHPEPGYDGEAFEVPDGAIVVGGGLASIDVVKILQLEVYGRALRERGIDVGATENEHAGIPATLAAHGLTREGLGVTGCRLYYRRRKCDMPLAELPPSPSAQQIEKAERVRAKIMDNVTRKFLVPLEELSVPVAPLVEGDRLVGLRFRRTETRGSKVVEIEGSEHDVRAPLVISSIGSIPEPIEGIPQRGELPAWVDPAGGELDGLPGVYGLGNALTGKGNIRESRDSARDIAERVVARIRERPALTADRVRAIDEEVERWWGARGYTGYADWLRRHPPLERLR